MIGPDNIPGYWLNETGGRLRPAVEAYLKGWPMTSQQISAMRLYCAQWIMAPGFRGPEVEALRKVVHHIGSRVTLAAWLAMAEEAGCDPL